MDILHMILLDSIGQGRYLDIDLNMKTSAPSTLFIGVLWLSLLKKTIALVEETIYLMKNVYTYLNLILKLKVSGAVSLLIRILLIIQGCVEKLLYVYQKMDILSMILSDSVREESFINNDMGVLTPTLLCPLTKSIVLKTQEDLLLG